MASPPRLLERNYLSPFLDTAARVANGAEYVALGDSYAAAGTFSEVAPFDACTRTPRNLARQLAQHLQPSSFTDVSCAGAALDHITAARPVDATVVPPQADAVGPRTRLITLLAGFNSYGFGEVLMGCLTSYKTEQCRAAAARMSGDARRAAAEAMLRNVLEELHVRAPRARILVLGYLDMFDDYIPGCTSAVTPDGVAAWRQWFPRINPTLQQAAKAAHADYIAPPSGHGICTPDPYIELTGRDLRPDGPDAFAYHPNQAGQTAYSQKILIALAADKT